MPAVLVTAATIMRFPYLALAVAIASTHYVYLLWDGQAELTWVTGYILQDRFFRTGS